MIKQGAAIWIETCLLELDHLMSTVVTHVCVVQTRLILFFLVTRDSVRPVALRVDVRLLHKRDRK